MKSLFPNPFPRQRARVALGKGTWQEVWRVLLGTLRLILMEGQGCVRRGAQYVPWATSLHLDSPRSQDHSSHMLETKYMSQSVKFDHGGGPNVVC